MRIILHIGMAKSGSSALQHGLAAARARLLRNGVLYPKGRAIRVKHDLLVTGLLPRAPRTLARRYEGATDRMDKDCARWLRQLARGLLLARPHTLILSNESLFRVREETALRELASRLRQLGDKTRGQHTVEVIVYVRRPSEHYLSTAQQLLKASHDVRPINDVPYRAAIEGFASYVADKVHVIKYDRADWPGKDILRHFLDTFVPKVSPHIQSPPRDVNTSLSAEAMALLADYRRVFHAEDNNRITPDTNRLIDALTAADAALPDRRRPRLHEDVRFAVDHGSTDLIWLRDQHGVVFQGIDYRRIGTAPFEFRTECVADICPIDHERKALITLMAFHRLSRHPVHAQSIITRMNRRFLAIKHSFAESSASLEWICKRTLAAFGYQAMGNEPA